MGRYNNDTATICYLNGAINVLTSSLLFNDIFFAIKSGGRSSTSFISSVGSILAR